jgi:hypothetical protein
MEEDKLDASVKLTLGISAAAESAAGGGARQGLKAWRGGVWGALDRLLA